MANTSSNNFTVDEIGFIQLALTKVLAAAARGEIDLNQLAREELASRGLDDQGVWVGFPRAKQIHNAQPPRSITMTTQLGPAQHAILAHAINHTSGQIDWFPDHIKGGARKKVIDAMFNRALIINDGTNWIVANEGYEALGMARAIAAIEVASDIDPKIEAAVTAIEAAACAETKTPRTRDTSKQATVIRMLKRPEGATIPQIMAATGWLSHTVRGTFAGTFKKKLGLTLASDKGEGVRVYRIAD